MSTHVSNAKEDIPLESRHLPKAPDAGTENRKNNLPLGAIVRDMTTEGEHIPEMVKESTVWDVYNNEARKVDNELVKDWTASLNFLLVFAAIFAAVLTAFIIESKKMLEQDPTEILVDIAIQYLNNIAISINCLLFASLGASLIAALASVVALQWVADYDAAITRGGSSPQDRAERRHFRFAGVTRWKMGELIAALPLLLYSSVVLFWAGAIQWMWTLHPIVGYVVAGGAAIAVLFYGSTTSLGAVFVSSPFRTPLSRGLYWLAVRVLSLLGRVLLLLPIESAFRFSCKLYQTISLHVRRLTTSKATLDDQNRSVSSLDSSAARLPLSASIPKWIKTHLITSATSRHREDETAKQDPAVEQEALAWLAQQLPISDDSRESLLLCVGGIPALSTRNPPSPRFHDAPWLAILEVLSKHLMRQIFDPSSSRTGYQGVGILLQCIESSFIRNKVVPSQTYIRDPGDISYWSQCHLEGGGAFYFGDKGTPMVFLLARDVPVPSLSSKYELEATWKLIRWRNSIRSYSEIGDRIEKKLLHDDIWPEIFSDIWRYSPKFLESCLCHFRKWTYVHRLAFSGSSHYAVMFDSIVKQALHRHCTTGEALALVRAFAGYLLALGRSGLSETVDETNIILQPLSYTLVLGLSESTRATHHAIALILIRACKSPLIAEPLKWARWIILMLWIGIPKDSEPFTTSQEDIIGDSEKTHNIWEEIEMSSTSITLQGTQVEEIGRTLWDRHNSAILSLSSNAFENPQHLASDFLLARVPLTPTRGI